MNIQTNVPVGCAQVTLLLMGKGPWVHIRALCQVLSQVLNTELHRILPTSLCEESSSASQKTGKLKQKDQEAFWGHSPSVAALGSQPKSVLLRSPLAVLETILFSLPQVALLMTCCTSPGSLLFCLFPNLQAQGKCGVSAYVCVCFYIELFVVVRFVWYDSWSSHLSISSSITPTPLWIW